MTHSRAGHPRKMQSLILFFLERSVVALWYGTSHPAYGDDALDLKTGGL